MDDEILAFAHTLAACYQTMYIQESRARVQDGMMNYQAIITIEPGKRGGKPCIRGLRITVYDIMDYLRMDWHHTAIASWLRISSFQVLAAIKYIEEHREEVEAYLHCRRQHGEEVRARFEARFPTSDIRKRLLARGNVQG